MWSVGIRATRLPPESVWWWWTSKFIFLYICAVCVSMHVSHVDVGCLSAITYSFVLSFFVIVPNSPVFCACFSASLFTPCTLISPFMIYKMTLDLSLLPFHSHPQRISLCFWLERLHVAWRDILLTLGGGSGNEWWIFPLFCLRHECWN